MVIKDKEGVIRNEKSKECKILLKNSFYINSIVLLVKSYNI